MGSRMDVTLAVLDGGLSGVVAGVALLLIAIAAWRYMQFRTVTLRDATRALRRDAEQVRRTFEELLAKLEETADRAARDTQRRAAALQSLLKDADARIEALRGALPTPGASLSVSDTSPPPASLPPQPTLSPLLRDEIDAPPPPSSPLPVAAHDAHPAHSGPASSSTAAVRIADTTFDPPDPRFARILELAAAGQPAARIAEATRTPLGEVELVLNLHRFQSSVSL